MEHALIHPLELLAVQALHGTLRLVAHGRAKTLKGNEGSRRRYRYALDLAEVLGMKNPTSISRTVDNSRSRRDCGPTPTPGVLPGRTSGDGGCVIAGGGGGTWVGLWHMGFVPPPASSPSDIAFEHTPVPPAALRGSVDGLRRGGENF